MGNGMNKIIPGLWLGSIRDSNDKEQLEQNKITHILAIHDHPKQDNGIQVTLSLQLFDMHNLWETFFLKEHKVFTL